MVCLLLMVWLSCKLCSFWSTSPLIFRVIFFIQRVLYVLVAGTRFEQGRPATGIPFAPPTLHARDPHSFSDASPSSSPAWTRSEGCIYIGRETPRTTASVVVNSQHFQINGSHLTNPAKLTIKPSLATLISSKAMLVKKNFMRFHKT